MSAATAEAGRSALDELWGRLARPLNTVAAVEALVGVQATVARQLVGAAVAAAPATERLLDEMPRVLRSLSIATVSSSERMVGEVRGPVLWNETMSARSATAGDPGLFVCAAPARAYDTAENRVLAGALSLVRRAGHATERGGRGADELLRRARHNGGRAGRYLEHRSLSSLEGSRPTRREIRRTRAGPRRRVYAPALDVLALGDEPVGPEHLASYCDARTRAQHDLLVAVLHRLTERGLRLPAFHVEGTELVSGPVRYRHRRHHHPGEVTGIVLGPVLIDVPDPGTTNDPAAAAAALEDRSPEELEPHLVLGQGEIGRAVDRALSLGLSSSG